MSKSRTKLSTIASSLLLACSLALVGAPDAKFAHGEHTDADSRWGLVMVAENEEAAQEPVEEITPEPEAVPADSAWG